MNIVYISTNTPPPQLEKVNFVKDRIYEAVPKGRSHGLYNVLTIPDSGIFLTTSVWLDGGDWTLHTEEEYNIQEGITMKEDQKEFNKATINNHKEFMEAMLAGETVFDTERDKLTWKLVNGTIVSSKPLHRIIPHDFTTLAILVKTININGHEVPAPVREELPQGTIYYMPVLGYKSLTLESSWDNDRDSLDKLRLNAGLIHLTEDAAIAHARALLSLTER